MKNLKFFIVLFLISFLSTPAGSSGNKTQNTGEFIYSEGEVQMMLPGKTDWTAVKEETLAKNGSVIKTAPDSFARLELGENTEIDLNEETSFEIGEKDNETSIDLFYGAMRARVKTLSDEQLEIKTPAAIAAVRGTDFAVIYEEKELCEAEVYTGSIELTAMPQEKVSVSPVDLRENLFALVRLGRPVQIIGKITDTRKLRWVHLEERIKNFRNIRNLKKLEASLQRSKGMLKKAEDEETRNQIREEISSITAERASLKKEINRSKKRLDKISNRYSRIRKEKAQERRGLIEEKRHQIIKQRLKRIKDKRKKRRKRLK